MNLASIIEPHPAQAVALISRGQTTTYGELREQVANVRGGLLQQGIGAGDRVALIVSNGRPFVVSYLAVLGIGAVAVPLNPTSPAPELQHQVSSVGAVAVVVDPAASATWVTIVPAEVPSVRTVIATDDPPADGHVAFSALLAGEAAPIVARQESDLAALIFTSGTAGAPRAAMLTHGNLLANLQQSVRSRNGLEPSDVVYGVLPLFHIMGLNVVLGLTLQVGASVVLVQRFDPTTALETIAERGVTVVFGAPPMWVAFSHFDEAPHESFAGVRLCLTGAAKMSEEAIRRLRGTFGIELREGYGLTEASPIVTSSVGIDLKIGSVGQVLDGIDVRIVDEAGDDVLEGDTGEIWVKGPNVFGGYLNDPQSTARALTDDGWLRTGDIGLSDSNGYLYLVDRAKDLVIVSGFNVFPAEVEEVLSEYPGVREVAVVGVAHPHTGEAVKAFVVADDSAGIDEDTLIAYCAGELARYKCPSKIVFVAELPRNVSGKLLRRAL